MCVYIYITYIIYICNEEPQCTLSTSCAQGHELPQSHFGDNGESTMFL